MIREIIGYCVKRLCEKKRLRINETREVEQRDNWIFLTELNETMNIPGKQSFGRELIRLSEMRQY